MKHTYEKQKFRPSPNTNKKVILDRGNEAVLSEKVLFYGA